MDHIRIIAYETVLRACGFGSLAIFCVMVGMSFNPRACVPGRRISDDADGVDPDLQGVGGAHQESRRTELWLYLPKEQRPPEGNAQWAIATAMRETYLDFAQWTTRSPS